MAKLLNRKSRTEVIKFGGKKSFFEHYYVLDFVLRHFRCLGELTF